MALASTSKVCTKCKEEKPLDSFYRKPKGKYGRSAKCIVCQKDESKAWRILHPDQVKEQNLKSYIANRHKQPVYRKRHNPKRRKRYQEDFVYRLECVFRSRTRDAFIAQGVKKQYRSTEMLGCTPSEFKKHILGNLQPGMTEENYGTVWHIDHTRPCAGFNLVDHEQVRQCFHWSNLMPMFADKNRQKGPASYARRRLLFHDRD